MKFGAIYRGARGHQETLNINVCVEKVDIQNEQEHWIHKCKQREAEEKARRGRPDESCEGAQQYVGR